MVLPQLTRLGLAPVVCIALVAFACNAQNPLPLISKDVTRDEYEMYTLAINAYKQPPNLYILVYDSTTPNHPPLLKKGEDPKDPASYFDTDWMGWGMVPWPELDVAIFRPLLQAVNQKAARLYADSIHISLPVRGRRRITGNIVRGDTLNGITVPRPGAWERGEFTSFEFSRAAIHPSGEEAIFYMRYYCGALCAGDVWFWCTREDGRWRIYKQRTGWIS